jgi:hypothetical protein
MAKSIKSVPQASSQLNLLLTIFALFWIGVLGYFLYIDVAKVAQGPDLAGIDAVALNPVRDTSSGWFPAARDPFFSWEDGTQGWALEEDDPAALTASTEPVRAPADEDAPTKNGVTAQLQSVDTNDAVRGKALAIPVDFPDPVTIFRDNIANKDDKFKMAGIRFVSYDVFVPREFTGYLGCLLFLKDKDGLWYQARSKTPLLPGRWTTIAADIRGESPDVTPLGHLGQWDENQATRVRTIGITFYGDKPFKGQVLLDNFRGWVRPQRFDQILSQVKANSPVDPGRTELLDQLAEKAHAFKDEPIKILNLRTDPEAASAEYGQMASAPVVNKLNTFTVRFELNRQAENPFDPDVTDIRCQVETPSGKKVEHIGFWYQDYDREDRFSGDELLPLGRPEWRVRITPREEGEYKYSLVIKMRKSSAPNVPFDLLQTSPRRFTSITPAKTKDARGFIRVSQQDPRWFEFENGDFFYPVGHNLHSPVDLRCWKEIFKQPPPAGRGLPMYRDFFNKMQKNGENLAEVWMSSWWVGIEWTSRWRNYYGFGRYSLQNAWKLDYLLEMARERGIHIHLVLDNHGKFSSWCDWEWDLNPYNKAQGGFISTAREFFTDESARRLHKNRLRYIASRWGADPAIMGWELVSEYDLVGGTHRGDNNARMNFHRSQILRDWAREMITHLRQYDVYDHPVTNHYASDFQWVDAELAFTPLFDYIVTDAYRSDRNYSQIAGRTQNWVNQQSARFNTKKPFWITEFGGDWNATAPAALEADAHCGLWSTWMTEGAGTPLLWWYDFVDRNDLYTYYRAFSNYIKGEDRRGINGVIGPLGITEGNTGALLSSTYRWNRGAYAWVYSRPAMEMMPRPADRQTFENVQSAVVELDAGTYRIEYWDCYEGTITRTEQAEITAGQPLPLKFPPFINNMAVKVIWVDASGPGAAASTDQPAASPPLPQSSASAKPDRLRRN